MRFYMSARARLGVALVVSSLASIGLYLAGAIANHSAAFAYLIWNLFLAWLPLLFAILLAKMLKNNVWSSWRTLLMSVLWLGFLPNSFYMVSDFVHVQEFRRVDLLYDIVMFAAFVFTAEFLGFLSLYIVHMELAKRVSRRLAAGLITLALFVCSFAVYVGRDLRWNTWDVVVNPAGMLVDISDHVLNPRAHPQALTTTLSFFVLLGSIYIVAWQVARYLRQQKTSVT